MRLCEIPDCGRRHFGFGLCHMHYMRVRRHGDPLVGPEQLRETRFWSNVDKRPDGCWLWTGATNWGGYGRFRGGDADTAAHRYAYKLLVGPIPDGLHLDHLCRVRHCVNPAHLEPVTSAENNRRGMSPSAMNARKQTCLNGHPLSPLASGARYCRQCNAAAVKKYRRALAAKWDGSPARRQR